MKFKSFISEKTYIHVGLIDNQPFLIDRGSTTSLRREKPLLTKNHNLEGHLVATYRKFRPSIGSPIVWIPISKYCWEDTFEFNRGNFYAGCTSWISHKLNAKFLIRVDLMENMMKDGIAPHGIYKGIFTLYVHGKNVWAHPTEYC